MKDNKKKKEYNCGCGKPYKSYTGLYMHIKNIHSGLPPPGSSILKGKSNKMSLNYSESENLLENKAKMRENDELYIEEQCLVSWFSSKNLLGSTKDPLSLFPELVKATQYTISCYLPIYSKTIEMIKLENYNLIKVLQNRQSLTVDDVLGLFLMESCKTFCAEFCKVILFLLRFLREMVVDYSSFIQQDVNENQQISLDSPEQLPECCNFFLNYFLPRACPAFDIDLAKIITIYFCFFMYKYEFTNLKISLA